MARLYALLSATCSLAYLLGLVVGVFLFLFSWKTAIAVILLACVCAPLARVLDRMKYQEILRLAVWSSDRRIRMGDGKAGWQA